MVTPSNTAAHRAIKIGKQASSFSNRYEAGDSLFSTWKGEFRKGFNPIFTSFLVLPSFRKVVSFSVTRDSMARQLREIRNA